MSNWKVVPDEAREIRKVRGNAMWDEVAAAIDAGRTIEISGYSRQAIDRALRMSRGLMGLHIIVDGTHRIVWKDGQ